MDEKKIIKDNHSRAELVAWQRKWAKMKGIIEEVNEVEQEMMPLFGKKIKLVDEIIVLRRELMERCIHPRDMLVKHEGKWKCKFCETVIKVHDDAEG